MAKFSREECLAVVEASPAAVARHDKVAWLALFARHAVVEDPVGSAPHDCGPDNPRRLGQFYDTFIAPNDIHFEVQRDVVCAQHAMRDVTIVIGMSKAVTVRVPVHLLYELVEESGELRIGRLAAHWELWPMLRQQLSGGLAFVPVGCASFVRMLRHLGPRGVAGFLRARSSVGAAGKETLEGFAAALAARDARAMAMLLADAEPVIHMPWGSEPLSVEQCAARGGELRLDKVLAAGRVVTASCVYREAGALEGEALREGVVLCELDAGAHTIQRLACYWE